MKKIKKIVLGMLFSLMLLIVLSAGVFLYKTNKEFDKVVSYNQMVQEELDKAGISEYRNLALAIIFTETKGEVADLMQSSESVHGTAGEILDSKESIRAGIDFLSKAIQESKKKKCDIWTAVQAYNFGLAYIPYVAKNGGVNTLKLADEYSKNVVAPSLGNTEGAQYSFYHPQALLYNGGKLYTNGGNLFYAKIVEINEWILVFLKK